MKLPSLTAGHYQLDVVDIPKGSTACGFCKGPMPSADVVELRVVVCGDSTRLAAPPLETDRGKLVVWCHALLAALGEVRS